MKLFLNKSIKLKIVIALIIALLASFAIPTFSNAGIKDSIGQMLFGALKWIFVKIGDGVVWLLNYTLMDNDETLKTVGEYDIPNYKISPEEIFKNKVPILDANVFSPLNDEHSTAKMLRGAISSVYNSLRYIALIALMCILIYLGIQIVIADNTGKKKAQYKTILQKWLIAVLLVFGLHYLMVGSMFLSDKLVEVFSAGNSSASFEVKVGTENVKTNLMGYVRCLIETEKDQVKAFSYVVIFWAIIILTILFALKYFERIAMLIFLIAIAPIVAATYPLDNSKSFNRWFKKYFSYLLMQPIDMLCYFVLILSATNLVTTNVIYAVVAIFFINKAEDMVRSIFGIDDPTGAKGAFGPQALAGYLGAKIGTASKNLSKSSGDNGGNSKSGEAQTKKPKEYDKNNNSGDARGDVKSKNTSIKTTGSGQEDGKIPTVDNPYDESSNVIGVNAIGDEKSDKDNSGYLHSR